MSAVLVYHLWPTSITGGFVGVDVFFVISGFLITSHLLTHIPSTVADLLRFWSRRLRRLLPASLLVLTVTLVASRLVAPETQWANTAAQVKAAALYVVNWRLASDSVDYLAAANAASPVQHFWSLSVEEQFYLVWPILILVTALAARRLRARPTVVVTGGLAAVVVVSLAYSVHLTEADPSRAYFVTPTRVWELGVGGLVAAVFSARAFGRSRPDEGVPLRPIGRALLAWAGLVLVLVAVFRYDGATPFPGWQALIPVIGAAAMIAAQAPSAWWSPGRLFELRPVQWLGDVSYSVYLWHWPMIVLLPAVSGDHLGVLDKLAIVVATLVLAALTKRYVEDRFRTAAWGRPLAKPYVLAAVGMVLVVGAAAVQTTEVHHRETVAQQRLAAALKAPRDCFGASALGAPNCKPTTSGTLTPDPLAAASDKSHAYAAVSKKKDCFSYLPSFRDVTCSFGAPKGRVRVALVGNSHAGQWVDAIDEIARTSGWAVTTYLASQCAFSQVAQTFPAAQQSRSCEDWVRRTSSTVASRDYDLVIVANRISVDAVGHDRAGSQAVYRAGYAPVLKPIRASGAAIVALRDTPASGTSIPDCLASHTDDYTACNGTRDDWLPADPLPDAIRDLDDPTASVADLTNHICLAQVCPAVVGGVPVYFDGSHLTTTYAKTLAPYLAPYLRRAVA